MTDIETIVCLDKSRIQFSEYQKFKEQEQCLAKRIYELQSDLSREKSKVENLEQLNKQLEIDNYNHNTNLQRVTDMFEELKKENEQLKQKYEQTKQKLDWFLTETIAGKEYRPKEELEELQRENHQLKQQLENEKQLNAEIKKRLVEVKVDCEEFNHEYCDINCKGKRKELVDLYQLISDGLNETLLKQKEDEIKELKEVIKNLGVLRKHY